MQIDPGKSQRDFMFELLRDMFMECVLAIARRQLPGSHQVGTFSRGRTCSIYGHVFRMVAYRSLDRHV